MKTDCDRLTDLDKSTGYHYNAVPMYYICQKYVQADELFVITTFL